jgi:hypothetical protein
MVEKMFNLKGKKEKKHDAVQCVINLLEIGTAKASDEVQLMVYQKERFDYSIRKNSLRFFILIITSCICKLMLSLSLMYICVYVYVSI